MQHPRYFIDDAGEILAGAYDADRSGKNVVENESRDRKPCQERSHRITDDDIHTASYIHAAAFEINRTHRKTEQHDGKNEPRSASADRVLGNAACIKGRGSKIAENDSGAPPE